MKKLFDDTKNSITSISEPKIKNYIASHKYSIDTYETEISRLKLLVNRYSNISSGNGAITEAHVIMVSDIQKRLLSDELALKRSSWELKNINKTTDYLTGLTATKLHSLTISIIGLVLAILLAILVATVFTETAKIINKIRLEKNITQL